MFFEKPLKDFLGDIAAANPVPGGGTASAFFGALGASLALMVCGLTVNKANYEEFHAELRKAMCELKGLQSSLAELMDKDAEAYGKVLSALKLPKDSRAEREQRKQAVEQATLYAAEVPLMTAQQCLEVLHILTRVVHRINPNVITDLGVAVKAGVAGLEGALLNVKINLQGINESRALEIMGQLRAIEEEKQKLSSELNKMIEQILR